MYIQKIITFLALTVVLTLALGAVLTVAFRSDVAEHWDEKRCDPSVLALAGFFKPITDPRSPSKFAADNWSFCQKEYVQNAIREASRAPKQLAEAEEAVAGAMRGIASVVADVFYNIWYFTHTAYKAFMDQMKTVAKLYHNFMIQLNNLVNRLQASVLAIAYALISLINAIVSSIKFTIMVVTIILGIILLLQIILFYLLWPIMSLVAIVTGLITIATTMIQLAIAIALDVELFTSGGCFVAGTQIVTETGETQTIETIKIGTRLAGKSIVTAVHEFRIHETLFELNGVRVTGDHLVHIKEGKRLLKRIPVREHPDAISIESAPGSDPVRLWCLTTTTRHIPVQGAQDILEFADWEEIPDYARDRQMDWYNAVWSSLNKNAVPPLISKPDSNILQSDAGISPDSWIPVAGYFGMKEYRRAKDIQIGDRVYTRTGELTTVLGRVELMGDQSMDAVELSGGCGFRGGLVTLGTWIYKDGTWSPPVSFQKCDFHPIRWLHFYTGAGEFMVGEWPIRDASDVGLESIHGLVKEIILPM